MADSGITQGLLWAPGKAIAEPSTGAGVVLHLGVSSHGPHVSFDTIKAVRWFSG